MKIAIVDDDVQALEKLCAYMSELTDTSDIDTFSSGEKLLSVWSADMYDLIILDIFMDRLTGMETARRIRETDSNVLIVFATSSNEFASESYEVNACYYLHKPFGKERVQAMLDRLGLEELELRRPLTLPGGRKIPLRCIVYADFASHCVTLHCKTGEDITIRMPFSDFEPQLCGYPFFFSPCKGVIVNFHEVVRQGADTFVLSNGDSVPISRRRAREVREAYSAFCFDRLRKGGGA